MIYLTKCGSGCCNEAENELNTIYQENVETRLEKSSKADVSTQSWQGSLTMYPTIATWSVQTSIPLSASNLGKLSIMSYFIVV